MDNQLAIELWKPENIWASHKELSRPEKTNSKLAQEIGKSLFYFTESAKYSGVDPTVPQEVQSGERMGDVERLKLKMLRWKSMKHLDLQIPMPTPKSPEDTLPLPPTKH